MCYAAGPRCTNYAVKGLERAKYKWNSAATDVQRDIAMAGLKKAQNQFYTTPGGFAYLQEKIDSGQDPDGIYEALLNKGKYERKQSLGMIKAKDVGDTDEQHIADTPKKEKSNAIQLVKDPNKDPGMYIDSIASVEDFNAAVDAGLVYVRPHPDPEVPYVIFDYAEITTFTRAWNSVTVASRGLIVNKETGEIVARPFRKFFNDGENVENYNDFTREGPVVVTDKADGSMGILYKTPDGKSAFSTRGSMNSEQAHHATALYNDRYEGKWSPRADRTYLYEVIYPQNRIVLDYGDKDDIVLIGAVDKGTGISVPLNEVTEWNGDRVEQYTYKSYAEALTVPVREDREGYVVHFTNSDERVKLKGDRYIELHKVMTGVTPARIWEKVSAGESTDDWLASVPEEFASSVSSYEQGLRTKFKDKKADINKNMASIKALFPDAGKKDQSTESRKAMAAHVFGNFSKRDASYAINSLMSLDSDKPFSKVDASIWKELRPSGKESL